MYVSYQYFHSLGSMQIQDDRCTERTRLLGDADRLHQDEEQRAREFQVVHVPDRFNAVSGAVIP